MKVRKKDEFDGEVLRRRDQECRRMDEGNLWFPELFRYDTERNFFETNNMEKVKSVKLFKNGRVDIKFRSVAYVQEFVEICLRRKVA